MSHVKVICIAIDRFNHGVQTFKVGKRKVFDQLYGIERHELCRFIRVELLYFTGTPDFRVTLKVVVYVLRDFRVALRLFQTDVRKCAVAQVLHGACLQYLAVVHITFHECIACLREFDFALDFFLHHEAELVAQAFHELDAFFVRVACKSVFASDVFEFLVRELVQQVFQKPNTGDVFGTRGGPCNADNVTLVLVVRAREVELVPVLESVEFVFKIVEVVPVVLEGESVKNRLPARTELAECLEATVKSRVVESALAREYLAVLDGDECALQHRFCFNLALGVTVNRGFVNNAHEEDGTRLELGRENLVHIATGELGKVIHGLLRDNALELSEVQLERLQPAGCIVENAIHGAVEVIALASGAGAVCKLRLREYKATEL